MAVSPSRQPHNIHLPPSPAITKLTKQSSRKGKGKEHVEVHVDLVSTEPFSAGNETPWTWKSLTDSFASSSPPVFTKDGSYFFSLVGPSVKIISVATGQTVSTLSAPARTKGDLGGGRSSDDISSAVLNPHNVFQLITGSLNGCIMVWDYVDAALLQTIDIGQPIHYICAHETFKDYVFVSASHSNRKKADNNAVVIRVSLKPTTETTESRFQKSSEITVVGKTRLATGLTLSPSGSWLVVSAGHKAYVAMTSSLKAGFTKYVSPERLTCLAFHPLEEYFATGDEKGNIRLWYCLNDRIAINAVGVEKKAQTTTLHWHAHAVSSITFSSNGAYLLSGGEESVLVIWQLHTGKKEFVPRVGAPIKTVALSKTGDSEEYLLGLADATYVFVRPDTLRVSRSYSQIKLDPATSYDSPSTSLSASTAAPLAVHSLTSTFILPSSHPSSLQTYSPSSIKLVSELEVSPSNRVSRRDEKPIEPSRVERAIVSHSGEWMATVDARNGDDAFRGEIYLKLWWWDRKVGNWTLNTRIDRPHGLTKVTAAAFSPSPRDGRALQLVTTGGDRNVKTWRIRTSKDKTGQTEEYWVARSTFSFRSEHPTHASWSPDGSLLALSLGPYVALYDPTTNVLRQTLSSPEIKSVVSAHFIGREGRYLAVAGLADIVLWDLVTQNVRWHYRSASTINDVAPHPLDTTFAVFSSSSANSNQETLVSIFNPSSANPIRTHSVPFGLRNVAWFSSRPPVASSFSLVAITQKWGVVLMGDDVQLPEEEGSSAREIAVGASSSKKTLFQDIFGKSAFGNASNEPSSAPIYPPNTRPWSGKEIAGIFDGPAYLLPPLESLFDPLISSFLKTRSDDPDDSSLEGVKEAHDEDVDMEEESNDPIIVSAPQKRVVDQVEMEWMIDLFKMHSVKSKPSTAPAAPPVKANGAAKAKANGTHQSASPAVGTPKPNGGTPRPKPALPKQIAAIETPAAPSPSTIANGKKRKKSLS